MTESNPGFYYHKVTNEEAIARMEGIRRRYIALMEEIVEEVPIGRERSIAISHLQTALMFTIAAIAIDKGELQYPQVEP